MNKHKSRRGNIFITLGVILLLCSIGLVIYNIRESYLARSSSNKIQEQLADIITEERQKERDYDYNVDPINREMETVEIDGYRYLGVIEIPDLNISLPVMDECDYIRLRIAPCHWYGSYYTDDFIICAHNYPSHFNPIRWININTDVYFTNVEGVTIHYIVSNIETIMPDEVDKMKNNSKNSDSLNDWDMTLFTCNYSGQNRCAVRCSRVDE